MIDKIRWAIKHYLNRAQIRVSYRLPRWLVSRAIANVLNEAIEKMPERIISSITVFEAWELWGIL